MAYDEDLADRVRDALAARDDVRERKMFGGLCFLASGNMVCGVISGELLVRVGPEAYEDALDEPHARITDFTNRPMRGMVTVESPALADAAGVAVWVERGLAYALSLPPK